MQSTESTSPAGVLGGRESRQVRLLARLLDGFVNPTRLSALMLLAREGELMEAIGAPWSRVGGYLG